MSTGFPILNYCVTPTLIKAGSVFYKDTMITVRDVLNRLDSLAKPENIEGMARYGICTRNALGVPVAELRKIAKTIGTDHRLALELWDTGIHEARILAGIIDDPAGVTGDQLERWILDVDSWDVCDQLCGNLIERTLFAYNKAAEWSLRDEEFVKRAGFSLMARLAVSDKEASDETFLPFLRRIYEESADQRNFVKKAVNWALRQIGKRNTGLHKKAVETAERILRKNSRTAHWIARDALRELAGEKVRAKLKK